VKRFRIGHYLKTSLWLLPVLLVLAGVALSLITTSIDERQPDPAKHHR